MREKSEKTDFLDGAMKVIALLCENIDFVSSFGVIELEVGAIDDEKRLLKALGKYSSDSSVSTNGAVNWEECLKALFDKWVMCRISVKVDDLSTPGEKTEQLCEFFADAIDSGDKVIKAKHINMFGNWWDHDAEGLIIDNGVYSCLIYFMFSD